MEWIDRYVMAVVRYLPAGQRKDAEVKLRGQIDSLIENRCSGQVPTEDDIKAVLLELGHPRRLADTLRGQQRYLIGPDWIDLYWLVLRIVLIVVGAAVLLSMLIQMGLQPPESAWEVLGAVFGSVWQALIGAFAMITIVFALNEFYNPHAGKAARDLTQSWKPEDLPKLTQTSLQIKRGDPISSIIFTLIFLAIINVNPGLIGLYFRDGTSVTSVPLFSHVFRDALLWINLTLLLGLALEVVKLITSRWTLALAGLHMVCKIPGFLVSVWLFANPDIFNDAFFTSLRDLFSVAASEWPQTAPQLLRQVLLGLIIFGFVIDTLVVLAKVIRLLSTRKD